MKTNRGKITIEINGNIAPVTAGNFIDLIEKGVYKDTKFHRVIKRPFPFIAQGGDPLSKNLNTPKDLLGTGNYIESKSGKIRYLPLEIKLKSAINPYYNKFITDPNHLSDLEMRHDKGVLAMARSQLINSASAQFYFALKPLPELDGRYSVFGKVVKGISILEKIEQGDKVLDLKILNTKKTIYQKN